jgi:sugar phosphate isomerase/epimerase
MFDVHNTADETLSHTELVRKYFPYIRHVHVNEMDGQEPGRGHYNFGPLLNTLAELDYSGWVSLEAFDFTRDPRQVAAGAITHLKASVSRPLSTPIL